jgi:hypothetical protein
MAVQEPGRRAPASYTAGVIPFSRVLMFAACILFVLAAIAVGARNPLGGITAWTWGFAGFAATTLSWALALGWATVL